MFNSTTALAIVAATAALAVSACGGASKTTSTAASSPHSRAEGESQPRTAGTPEISAPPAQNAAKISQAPSVLRTSRITATAAPERPSAVGIRPVISRLTFQADAVKCARATVRSRWKCSFWPTSS